MKHIFISKIKEDLKASDFLAKQLFGVSKNKILQQIKRGELRVNGEKAKTDITISTGDEVRFFLPSGGDCGALNEIKIVFENNNLIVADKPILCEVETHLLQQIKKQKEDIAELFPVHRLDTNTTGLVVFAKNKLAEENLKEQFKTRKVQKFYRAIVVGHITPKEKQATVYIRKHADKAVVSVKDKPQIGYHEAILNYRLVNTMKDNSLLDIKLLTGRTHQIRATMAHLGHPVLGDGKYGNEKTNRAASASYQKLRAYKLILQCGLTIETNPNLK